jgi:hypothetical protein
MRTLQELTGQESGIVIYEGYGSIPEAIVCNWSHIDGYPRIDPLGLMVIGFSEEIPDGIDAEHTDDVASFLDGVMIIFADDEEMPEHGTVYRPNENIIIIAPEGWN